MLCPHPEEPEPSEGVSKDGREHYAFPSNSHPNFSFALRASSGLGVFDGGN